MLEAIDAWLRGLGAWGYLALGVAALLEYLVPPVPGDSVAVLGGAAITRAEYGWPQVLLALTLGSVVGIVITWRVGLALGTRLDHLPDGRVAPGITGAQLKKAQQLMRERGALLLLFNRFLPSFRAVLFVAAGAAEMRLGVVLALGVASSLAWNCLLVFAGATLGTRADAIEAFLLRFRVVALGLVALALAGMGVRTLWRRRAR